MENLSIKSVFTKDFYTTNEEFGLNFVERTAHITDSNGNVIFHMDNIIVPDFWSQTAINILAQKYFRKTGVPLSSAPVIEKNIPFWVSRRVPEENTKFTGENDLRQVVSRLVGHWVYTGFKNNYFKDEEEGYIFQQELKYMLYYQIAAPNSPQWFNTGLWWAYGIEGNQNNDHHAKVDVILDNTIISQVNSSYQYPQIHACFINRVEDKIVGKDGIMDLFGKEARIFKYGSGSGCNYSNIRGKGEPLSGGGISSGLLSFLKIGDTVGGLSRVEQLGEPRAQ
jgi:ribonucleoside-diphosphate reductase alpha chain